MHTKMHTARYHSSVEFDQLGSSSQLLVRTRDDVVDNSTSTLPPALYWCNRRETSEIQAKAYSGQRGTRARMRSIYTAYVYVCVAAVIPPRVLHFSAIHCSSDHSGQRNPHILHIWPFSTCCLSWRLWFLSSFYHRTYFARCFAVVLIPNSMINGHCWWKLWFWWFFGPLVK